MNGIGVLNQAENQIRFKLDIKTLTAKGNAYEVKNITKEQLFGKDCHFVSAQRLRSQLRELNIKLSSQVDHHDSLMHYISEHNQRLIDGPEIILQQGWTDTNGHGEREDPNVLQNTFGQRCTRLSKKIRNIKKRNM